MTKERHRPPRLLVASDQRSEALSLQRLLSGDYEDVTASFDPDRVVDDFRQSAPDVLVLAFDRIEKAQNYYLALYRFGADVHEHPHRTILLCHKDEVKKAFGLCRKQFFDDYVMFWPVPYDGCRLPMSIHVAFSELRRIDNLGTTDVHLHQHARHLARFGQQLNEAFKETENEFDAASRDWTHTRRKIDDAIHDLTDKLTDKGAGSGIKVENAQKLRGLMEHFSHDTLLPLMDAEQAWRKQPQAWVRRLQKQFQEHMSRLHLIVDVMERMPRRILIVDDDDFSQQLVAQMLEREGFETVLAATGAEALNLLTRHHPALVLMDIDLPGLDGVEVTRRLKSSPQFADIPVIMLTGYGSRDAVMNSISVGASDFVVKPVHPDALLSKVRRYLDATVTEQQ